MTKLSAFMLAAPASNSGKTLLSMGLIHLLVKRGLKVQPFKCGPDYIDPMYHSLLAGRPSYNLDLWMAGEHHVKQIFQRKCAGADLAIVEGVMGLFDGADGDRGSSAHLARVLELPVILVVEASGVAHSVAPLLYGFRNYDQHLNVAGVIFNKVASHSHFKILHRAAEEAGVKVLGYVPRDPHLKMESRHLGLHLPEETAFEEILEKLEGHLDKHIDLDSFLAFTPAFSLHEDAAGRQPPNLPDNRIRIALASDEAFRFSYQANLDALSGLGDLVSFSPLRDKQVPEADLVWLPGGYPELFGTELAANHSMKQSVHEHVLKGKALVAECGGMMYLGEKLITKDGQSHDMAGLFAYECSFENARLHLGYRELKAGSLCFRGHEFHYSSLTGREEGADNLTALNARGKEVVMPVFRKKNCWASYLHLYLGERARIKAFLNQLGL
ncbi:MAG: cobyrinic acid a,c-diamide synthase [Bacteroidetes bacterium]|nr:MAG: cobyrinic acid a,c-diamide synthase [Bacteroidota bacterium]